MSDESDIDKRAVAAITRQFLELGGHQLENPREDYGRDDRLIFRDGDRARGYSTSLQVKGTASIEAAGRCGFKFEVDVKNLVYLDEGLDPAYYLIHDVRSGITYWREVHEIVGYFDKCRPDWKQQKTLTITFKTEDILDAKSVAAIAEEANAWAMERRTTRETVDYLDAERQKFAGHDSSTVPVSVGLFMWSRLSGRFAPKTLSDSIALMLLVENLAYGTTLGEIFRQRAQRSFRPHEVGSTGLGAMGLRDLTRRLEETKARHIRLLAQCEDLIRAASMEPTKPPAWTPPPEPGVVGLRLDDIGARDAALAIRRRFERLGLTVEPRDGDLDLVVTTGLAKGLVSLSVFDSRVDRQRITRVRDDLTAIGGSAGIVLIKYCQFEESGIQNWECTTPLPQPLIPFGTAVPLLEQFELELLAATAKTGQWRRPTIGSSANEIGLSFHMPEGIEPRTNLAVEYQQVVVRSYLQEVVERLRAGLPTAFVFHWDISRVEIHTIKSASDAVAYCLKGLVTFRSLGGGFMVVRRQQEGVAIEEEEGFGRASGAQDTS